MGMFAVDFIFDCDDDNGVDLAGARAQEMDAFIGYGGRGRPPPPLIHISRDRSVTCAITGMTFDPALFGYELETSCPFAFDDPGVGHIGVKIINGRADQVLRFGYNIPGGWQ